MNEDITNLIEDISNNLSKHIEDDEERHLLNMNIVELCSLSIQHGRELQKKDNKK